LNAQTDARGLVRVRGTDTFARRTQLRAPKVSLDHAVQDAVIRHDQMRVPTDEQPVARDPLRRQRVDLTKKNFGVDHDAVTDGGNGGPEDAAGDQPQLEDRLPSDDGVTGIRSTLAADDHAGVGREDVDGSSFALIAPLGADENGQWHRTITNQKGAG